MLIYCAFLCVLRVLCVKTTFGKVTKKRESFTRRTQRTQSLFSTFDSHYNWKIASIDIS